MKIKIEENLYIVDIATPGDIYRWKSKFKEYAIPRSSNVASTIIKTEKSCRNENFLDKSQNKFSIHPFFI